MFNDKTFLCEVWKCQVLHIPFCVWVHSWKQLFNWSLSFHLHNMSSQQNDCPLLFLLDDWKGMLPDRLTLTISFYRILLFGWENPVNERMLACFSTVTVCLLILIFLTTVPFYDKSLAPGHVWTADFSVPCTVHKNCALANWATGDFDFSFKLCSITNGALSRVFRLAAKHISREELKYRHSFIP